MTDQERQMLEELASRIQKAPPPQIDRDADELIRRSIGSRADALYILTQTVLIQEMALNQAKQQLEDLKRQQPPQSFLPNNAQPPSAPPAGGYRSSSYQTSAPPPFPAATPPPLPPSSQQQYPPPDYAPQPTGGRFSGFLRNAAQTAAGVIAGEAAFSAISSLFGHHENYYGGGSGGFFGGGAGLSPASETIINNYYEDDRGHERDHYTRDDISGERASASGDDTGAPANDNMADIASDDNMASDDTYDTSDEDSSYDDGSDTIDV